MNEDLSKGYRCHCGAKATKRRQGKPICDMCDRQLSEVTVKASNPKDAVGIKKWRQFCTIPLTVMWEVGVAMLEGARKYGRHNYRAIGVRASVYVDAAIGHISQYWEGEDIDADSKIHHVTKAIASLVVLRDSMIKGCCVDDRPPKTDMDKQRENLQDAVEAIFDKIPDAVEPYTEENRGTRW